MIHLRLARARSVVYRVSRARYSLFLAAKMIHSYLVRACTVVYRVLRTRYLFSLSRKAVFYGFRSFHAQCRHALFLIPMHSVLLRIHSLSHTLSLRLPVVVSCRVPIDSVVSRLHCYRGMQSPGQQGPGPLFFAWSLPRLWLVGETRTALLCDV